MKKLMIAAGFGLLFTALSVMPAKADGPRHDRYSGFHERARVENREFRRAPERRVERFDRHETYHRDFRSEYRHCR